MRAQLGQANNHQLALNPSDSMSATRLAVCFGFEVLVQLLIQALVVFDAADVVQPPLTDLLSDNSPHVGLYVCAGSKRRAKCKQLSCLHSKAAGLSA